jgi:hypothetical protein
MTGGWPEMRALGIAPECGGGAATKLRPSFWRSEDRTSRMLFHHVGATLTWFQAGLPDNYEPQVPKVDEKSRKVTRLRGSGKLLKRQARKSLQISI